MAEGTNHSHFSRSSIYELQEWLKNLLGDDSYLNLPSDKKQIELLLDLKSKNEEAEKCVIDEIKTKQTLINDYSKKTVLFQKIIESEGVELSEEADDLIKSLVALGAKMKLDEPDITNYLVAMCDVQDKHLKSQEQELMACHEMTSLSKKIANIQKQNKALERNSEALEKTVAIQEVNNEKLTKSLSFMEVKRQDYERCCKKIEDLLNSKGYDPSLRHNCLVEKAKVFQELEEQYKKSLSHLETYKALPPNEALARLEVERKLDELNKLEKKFSEYLESLQNEPYAD